MFVNARKKIFFIHIPKTGGTAFKKMVGGFGRIGESHDRLKDCDLSEYRDYRFLTIVRNPYTRYASEYVHRHTAGDQFLEKTGLPECTLKDFPSYFNTMKEIGELQVQADYIDHPTVAPEVFKYEEADLSKIVPGSRKLGKSKLTNYFCDYDWREVLGNDGIRLVNEHCYKDFERFGYAWINL